MWFLFALCCSLFNALQGAYGKKILNRIDPHLVTWAMVAYALPLMGIALVIDGLPQVRPIFWPALAVTLAINLLAITLYLKAIKVSPLSLTIPFLAFTPIFLVLTGLLALGERPDAMGLVGIALIVVGVYVLNLDQLSKGLLTPFSRIAREPGSLLMLAVALLWGISATADKVALLNSSPIFFLFVFHLLYSLLYLPILRWKASGQRQQLFGESRALFFFAFLGAVAILAQMLATRMTLVSFVIAIKRAGMVFSILLGYLFFGERQVALRLTAAGLMIVGVGFILW